jgi:hypothetical protein
LCIERSLLCAPPFGTIRATQPGANPESLVTSMPQGLQKYAKILWQEAKQCWPWTVMNGGPCYGAGAVGLNLSNDTTVDCSWHNEPKM